MSIKRNEKEIKVVLRMDGVHRKVMFFNRFRVQRELGFRVVHFGLDSADGLLDSFCCIITDEAHAENQKSLVEYLGRIGQSENKPLAWNRAVQPKEAAVVDIINVAARDAIGEIVLTVYSQSAALRSVRESAPVVAEHMAMLRSSVEVQKQLLAAIYGE